MFSSQFVLEWTWCFVRSLYTAEEMVQEFINGRVFWSFVTTVSNKRGINKLGALDQYLYFGTSLEYGHVAKSRE